MAQIFTVPVRPDTPTQSIFCALGGRRYRVDLDWNGRLERWFLSLYSGDGTALVLGKGLVVGGDVLRASRHREGVPQGAITLRDSQNLGAEASLSSLGRRHTIVFVPLGSFP